MPSISIGPIKVGVGIVPRFAHGPNVFYIGASFNLTTHDQLETLAHISDPLPKPHKVYEEVDNPILGYINYGGNTYSLYAHPPVAKVE